MNDIIIDFFLHYPALVDILSDAIYVCPLDNPIVNSELSKQHCIKYNIKYIDKIPNKINNCFFIFPLLNIDIRHEPIRHQKFINCLEYYSNIVNAEKIIILDNHDYAILPELKLLDTIKYNFILKRNYHNNITYPSNVKPFHFIDCCGNFDPIKFILNNNNIKYTKDKINKIWFSGSIYNHEDKILNTFTNRVNIMQELNKYNIIDIIPRKPHKEYLNTIGKYKYAISLMGCSSWGTRHYEILSQSTILFSQACNTIPNPLNHIFPFDNPEIQFSTYNFFDSPEDLYNKYLQLEQEPKLYENVLTNQIKVVKYYYNKNYIKNIIVKYINAI
tara:strand:- start:141 stop:1133 length:993 start_codon:yes stop_codon:yes gene_type:complete